MSTQATSLVSKTITVQAPVERAFAVFTDGIADWWPLRTHSAMKEQAESVVLQPFEGGRLYETGAGGAESDWGTVLAFEPPHRLVVTWHPERRPDEATELEIRFTAEGDAATRVDLEHRGWEIRGDEAAAARDAYDEGWDFVLGTYGSAFEG